MRRGKRESNFLKEGGEGMSVYTLDQLLEKAIAIATVAHKGQKDKGGNPYIKHPEAVANRLKDVKRKIVAWLHDVIEDTHITAEDLIREGFPTDIVDAVIAMTRRKEETYIEFCHRVAENELAIDVKIEDIEENLDFSRIPDPTEEEISAFESRAKRYRKALLFLKEKRKTLYGI